MRIFESIYKKESPRKIYAGSPMRLIGLLRLVSLACSITHGHKYGSTSKTAQHYDGSLYGHLKSVLD